MMNKYGPLVIYLLWLITLFGKIAGFIDISWALILFPIWLPISLICFIVFCIAMVLLYAAIRAIFVIHKEGKYEI